METDSTLARLQQSTTGHCTCIQSSEACPLRPNLFTSI